MRYQVGIQARGNSPRWRRPIFDRVRWLVFLLVFPCYRVLLSDTFRLVGLSGVFRRKRPTTPYVEHGYRTF